MSSMAGREICNKALDHIGGKGRELNIKELVNRQAIIFTNKGCIFEGTIFFTGDRIHLYNNAGLGSQTAKSVRFAYRHLIKEAGYTRSSIQTGDLKFYEKIEKKSELGLGIADLSEINKPLNETEKKEEDLTLCSNVLWE